MDTNAAELYGKEKVSRILLRLAPPVMLAQLIQALYNIVDSLFVGRYSTSGLAALSIIYPIQLLMIAIAVGTGVGINTAMAARLGSGDRKKADEFAGIATPLLLILYAVFAAASWLFMPTFARMSTNDPAIIADVISYGRIVCLFSFGLFLESGWTKVLQAEGNMKRPMVAQILGAVTNIIADPLLIFGLFGLPEMGIAGAAVATVLGQIVAALTVMGEGHRKHPAWKVFPAHTATVFRLGLPNILMQAAYTFYIMGLNLILAGFCDEAVTALGLYYKWQTFFFIPLGAMQTCIVPVISYNYAARNIERCKKTLNAALLFGLVLMALGTLCFVLIPGPMLRVFTSDELVISIGSVGFRFTGVSFIPMVTSLIFPVFFQAVGSSLKSTLLTVVRTVVLFVPLGYIFSRFGLTWFWMTYPLTEIITSILGYIFYRSFLREDYSKGEAKELEHKVEISTSKPGIIITIARQHGSAGKQVGRLVAEQLGLPFYYKEVIALAAEESGLDREFIGDINKKSPKALRELYLSSHAVQRAVRAQEKIIRKIADEGSCVICGRAADHVLRDHDKVVRVFVHAPLEYRVKTVMSVYGDARDEAVKNIRHSDKARASYYRHISSKRWGEAENYELSVDSSIGVENTADVIVRYVKSLG